MINHAWVCFDCRMAVRRSGSSKDVRCPSCAGACVSLGYKVPIPPKAKIKAWSDLRERFYRYQRECWPHLHKMRVQVTHRLERQLQRLVSMPVSPRRARRIAYLKRELNAFRPAAV
jgi:hypothetical protein